MADPGDRPADSATQANGSAMTRVNIGCCKSPTPGWKNYDNSLSLWLSKHRLLAGFLRTCGLLSSGNLKAIKYYGTSEIEWADATERIPVPDGSASAVYSSHMLEHLDKIDREKFLREAHRVLCVGGILRLVVPDVHQIVHRYLDDGDADKMIDAMKLARERPRTLRAKISYLVVGDRPHKWMYDGQSLCGLLSSLGFQELRVMEPNHTRIADPGELNLSERAGTSVYVEAVK